MKWFLLTDQRVEESHNDKVSVVVSDVINQIKLSSTVPLLDVPSTAKASFIKGNKLVTLKITIY